MGFPFTILDNNKPVAKVKTLAHAALLLANIPSGSAKHNNRVFWNNKKDGAPGLSVLSAAFDFLHIKLRKEYEARYGTQS